MGRSAQMARQKGDVHPSNVLVDVKRLIGLDFTDSSVQQERLRCQYEIVDKGPGDKEFISEESGLYIRCKSKGRDRDLLPEEVSSFLLQYLRVAAEGYLEEVGASKTRVDSAVITVPARFGYRQRAATREAARLAGFRNVKLLAEPTAAAMAYGLGVAGSRTILVFDLGGGTFDVSIMTVDSGKFRVRAVGGEAHLGGNDIDDIIMGYVLQEVCKKQKLEAPCIGSKVDLASVSKTVLSLCACLGLTAEAISTIRTACQMAKIQLTSAASTLVTVDLSPVDAKEIPRRMKQLIPIDTDILAELTQPVVTKCLNIVDDVLQMASVERSMVDEIVLVGGSTRMPLIRRAVTKAFGGKELCSGISPDEVVGEGAGVLAAVLSGVEHGVLKDLLMMDVLPASIGLELGSGRFQAILPRNTSVPATRTRVFNTAVDNQPGITINVYEGDKEIARENNWMARFDFPIPKSRRGQAGQVPLQITFSISAGGMIRVQTDADEENAQASFWSSIFRVFFLVTVLLILIALLAFVKLRDDIFETVEHGLEN